MDFFYWLIILMVVLLAGFVLGLWLFVPWRRGLKDGGAPRLWVAIWTFGWALQAIGWLIYSQTYQRMDQYHKPVDFSKGLIGLSFLLWIVAFSFYRKVKPLGIIVLSGLLAVVVTAPDIVLQKDEAPSDQEMLANFQHHRTAFNQLLLMAQADKGLSSVNNGWTDPDNLLTAHVSQSRVDQYRKLFIVAGVISCSMGDQNVNLRAWGVGNALSSDANKGYAYLVKPPTNLLNSLDDCQPEDTRFNVEAYRHIEGNWYLFYEYIPS